MRTVALEEHFSIPSLAAKVSPAPLLARGALPPERAARTMVEGARHLTDLGPSRLADMDAAGITVQDLSWSGPGADILPAAEAVPWARAVNDGAARLVAERPDRYAAFAQLPVTAPAQAADELERCVRELGFVGAMVNGTTGGKFLDDPSFEPLLARAEALDVPIYIHPNLPPEAVYKAYFDNLPSPLGFCLTAYGFGWHAETAIHVLRLVFSGALERHRGLKLIIGHMGEFLPMTLARTDAMCGEEIRKTMSRLVTEQVRDQVWVTTSGQFTLPPFRALLDTWGVDRILFSVDYPYNPNAEGRKLLDSLPLSPGDVEKIAHGNADRLLKLRVG
jgi:predicted TIM-barrel fold metal-dependent hydrolase